jgi:hypothetical protein
MHVPYKEFLEEYPLYRKFKTPSLPLTTAQLPVVRIKMACPRCSSEQTFLMTNKYYENCEYSNFPVGGLALRLKYVCAHCEEFARYFFVKVADDNKSIMKIGQYPGWDVSSDPNIERILGEHADYFRKGLICESQGYGIGAFSYYRRIIEEIIGQLLADIAGLLCGEEYEKYIQALEETKKTVVTQEKIKLVQDLLPAILRPNGMNPLSTLHSVLSEGLHAESDEDCMEYAMAVREVLVFLVNQVAASKAASKGFTESMKKLLEKKSKKSS